MGKYKYVIKALSDTYNYFNDGFLKKLRDDMEKTYLCGGDNFLKDL